MTSFTPASNAAIDALLKSGKVWRSEGAAQFPTLATGHARLDQALPGGGWPRAMLSEVLHPEPGSGEFALVLPMVARLTQAGQHVAIVAPPLLPYAPGLMQGGVQLAQLLVVEPGARGKSARDAASEQLWASEQLLRAGYAAVLVWAEAASTGALRRVQLAAEDSGGLAVVFRSLKRAAEPSVAALRLAVTREHGRSQVQVLKSRGSSSARSIALAV